MRKVKEARSKKYKSLADRIYKMKLKALEEIFQNLKALSSNRDSSEFEHFHKLVFDLYQNVFDKGNEEDLFNVWFFWYVEGFFGDDFDPICFFFRDVNLKFYEYKPTDISVIPFHLIILSLLCEYDVNDSFDINELLMGRDDKKRSDALKVFWCNATKYLLESPYEGISFDAMTDDIKNFLVMINFKSLNYDLIDQIFLISPSSVPEIYRNENLNKKIDKQELKFLRAIDRNDFEEIKYLIEEKKVNPSCERTVLHLHNNNIGKNSLKDLEPNERVNGFSLCACILDLRSRVMIWALLDINGCVVIDNRERGKDDISRMKLDNTQEKVFKEINKALERSFL